MNTVAQNGVNGSPDKTMSPKDLYKRRDELEAAEVTNAEETAWAWMRLAADFDALQFLTNASRCRDKGTYYFGFETPEEPPDPEFDWQARADIGV